MVVELRIWIGILFCVGSGLSTNLLNGSPSAAGSPQVRYRLQKSLLANYDRAIVPLRNDDDNVTQEQGVNVTVYMWPYDILYVNEAQGSIKISGWIDMRWTDPTLMWDPKEHENITSLFIKRGNLWLPEVNIFYSKDEHPVTEKCSECPVRIDHHGKVLRGYYFAYSFPCVMQVKYFPFDAHTCTLELANWHLDVSMMDLWPEQATVDLTIFLPNEEWDISNMTVSRKTEFFNYGWFPILSYKIHIKRKPFYYIINLVVPTLILTCTSLIGYHMPSAGNGIHQEKLFCSTLLSHFFFKLRTFLCLKVKMGLTTILSIYILQLGVSDKLPRTSNVIPLIFVFYSCMVGLLSMAIVSTSFIILIEKQGTYGRPVPTWARMAFLTSTLRAKRDAFEGGCCQSNSKCKAFDCDCDRAVGPLRGSTVSLSSFSPQYQLLVTSNGNATATPDFVRKRVLANGGAGSGSPRTAVVDAGTYSALLDMLMQIKRSTNKLNSEMESRTAASRTRAEWGYLADSIENISFVMFMLGLVTSLILFFYHDFWY